MGAATAPRLGLVLDCVDPERLAVFWAAALDYANVGSAGAYAALYPRVMVADRSCCCNVSKS